MTDWKKLFEETKGDQPPPAGQDLLEAVNSFSGSLDALEFVASGVNKSSAVPDTYYLWAEPSLRPAERAYLFSFYSAPDELVVLGTQHRSLRTKEEVEAYLLEVAQSSAFSDTLAYYRSRAADPFEAVLRRNAERTTKADVVIKLERKFQEVLASATDATELDLDVVEVEELPLAAFDNGATYAALYSEGYLLKVLAAKRTGAHSLEVTVKGPSLKDPSRAETGGR